jgi:predicted phosphodiesterase
VVDPEPDDVAAPRPSARWRGVVRVVLPYLAVAAIGGIVALLALSRVSATTGTLGPGRVELRAGLHASGRTEIQLPPLGEIIAGTHGAPVALRARVDQIDIEGVQRLLAVDEPGDRLRAEVEDDLPALLRRFAVRTLLWALVIGVLTGALVSRHHLRRTIAGALGAVLVTAVMLSSVALGYRSAAFDQASFHGPIARAPAIFEAVARNVERLPVIRGKVKALSEQVAALYETTASDVVPPRSETVILHVSDIHSNPLGLEVARQLASSFRVDAVLDTGDLTSFGLPVEARVAELIASFPAPYYFVAGNHDSIFNRAAIDAVPNVTLLDGQVEEIAGVTVLGVSDPTFTADNELSTEEATELKRDATTSVRSLTLRTSPDVLAVHDPIQAQRCFGAVPVIVAGHRHDQGSMVKQGTRLQLVGSTGATGLGSFTLETGRAYEAELLRFSGGDLVAVDSVSLTGIDGSFEITRDLVHE